MVTKEEIQDEYKKLMDALQKYDVYTKTIDNGKIIYANLQQLDESDLELVADCLEMAAKSDDIDEFSDIPDEELRVNNILVNALRKGVSLNLRIGVSKSVHDFDAEISKSDGDIKTLDDPQEFYSLYTVVPEEDEGTVSEEEAPEYFEQNIHEAAEEQGIDL